MNRILFSFLASALSVAAFAVELDLAGEWSLIAVKDVQTGTYAKTDKPDVSPYIPAIVPGGVHDALLKAGRIKDVYYGSNEIAWSRVSIGSGNGNLTGATIYYYDANEPLGGNAWHFVSSTPTVWTISDEWGELIPLN